MNACFDFTELTFKAVVDIAYMTFLNLNLVLASFMELVVDDAIITAKDRSSSAKYFAAERILAHIRSD